MDIHTAIVERLLNGRFCSITAAQERADKLLSCQKLLPNIVQWLNGAPFTDVYVHGWSVPLILQLWGSNDAAAAMEILADLSMEDPLAELRIWSRVRR